MCSYLGYEFGAGRYPDSYCIDGSLHDADSDYLCSEDRPCPICRPKEAIGWWADHNESGGMRRRKAREMATSLVNDIRKNRGEEPFVKRRPCLTEESLKS